ncbi:MAG: hypothetical protein K8R59_17380 [Thermoanaerobaculales bacterium]|nr:hypothetical protein [Thermoanaerobaculales bacterium]
MIFIWPAVIAAIAAIYAANKNASKAPDATAPNQGSAPPPEQKNSLASVAGAVAGRKPATQFGRSPGTMSGVAGAPPVGLGADIGMRGPAPMTGSAGASVAMPSQQTVAPTQPEPTKQTPFQEQTKEAMGDKGSGFANVMGGLGQGAQIVGSMQSANRPPEARAPHMPSIPAPQAAASMMSGNRRRGQSMRDALAWLQRRQ